VRFACAQRLFRRLAIGDIARGSKPLHDFAIAIEQRDGARKRPAQCAVHANYPMFQFEHVPFAKCLFNGRHDARMVIRRDVFLQPCPAGGRHVLYKIPSLEVTHLAPIRTHLVDEV
jgi:hypothetical protein